MYVPPHSRENRIPVLQEAINRLAFGTLITAGEAGLQATHLPMIVDPHAGPFGTIAGHVARNNPQWRGAGPQMVGLATFLGPNFYVTPAWYETKAQTGKVVPTWNYIAVQARGSLRFFDDRERLLVLVERLTNIHEADRSGPWSVSDAPPEYIEAMLGAIVGFEMSIDSLEGAWKLGQHRTDADRSGVARGIASTSDDPAVHALLPLIRGESSAARASAERPG